MKRLLLTLLGALAFALLYASEPQTRLQTSFNFDWKFARCDSSVPEEGPQQNGFDDAAWEDVNLPHDFQISQPWVAPSASERPDKSDPGANVVSRLSSRGFKAMGKAWYRKSFVPSEEWKGRRVLVDFQGIMYVGDVFLNGERIGGTDYGYLGFEVDITSRLKWGEENVLAVLADTRDPLNSRWYTGGGLYRDVNIVVTDENLYLTRHPLYITTPAVQDSHADVTVGFEVANRTKQAFEAELVVTDAEGRTVLRKKDSFKLRQSPYEYSFGSLTINNPHLWDCDDPYLYNATVTLYDSEGKATDSFSEKFGVRSIEYSPKFGLKLNGKKVLLKGIANHHSLGALGAAAYPRAIEKRLQLLKSFGFNHIRTSHNPYSKDFLDLCDKYGILVVDELYDKWLDQYCGGRTEWMSLWQKDIPEWIKRDRTHPCVVMWSLGNELQTYWSLPFADWGVTAYRMQKVLLGRYDTTRPVTVAMHPRGRNQDTNELPAPLALETDIASYNYRYMYFPTDAKNFPNMIFYQSEANTSNMGPNFFEMDLDKVVGLAYWGQIDYLGESGGWPAKGWAQGSFDISLQPKPLAYLLKSMFVPEEPVVHIGIVDRNEDLMWNDVQVGTARMSDHWNRREGSTLTLYTYTNCEEVELYVCGKSVGVKKNLDGKSRNKLKWDGVQYKKGYIEAVGRNDGKVVCRHRIETAGKPVKLILEADNSDWKADGMDLQHIRVTAVDSKGRRCPQAQQMLSFSVEGDASLVAVDNGNIYSDELHCASSRSLYQGSALAILRSGREGGKVTLKVSCEGIGVQTISFEL